MPQWQPYDTTARATMTIDATCQSVNDFRGGDRVAVSALRLDPYNRSALFSYKDQRRARAQRAAAIAPIGL